MTSPLTDRTGQLCVFKGGIRIVLDLLGKTREQGRGPTLRHPKGVQLGFQGVCEHWNLSVKQN